MIMKLKYLKGILLGALALAAADAVAADDPDKLILHYQDGHRVEVLLADKPVITFQGGELCLKGTSTNIRCPLADLKNYTFTGQSMGVESVGYKPEVLFSREGDVIKILTEKESAEVALFDLQGCRLGVDPEFNGGYCIVDLGQMMPGVYILKIEGYAIKIVKE